MAKRLHPETGEKLQEGYNADVRGGGLRPRVTPDPNVANKAEEEKFFGQFQAKLDAQPTANDIFNKYNVEFGVPGLKADEAMRREKLIESPGAVQAHGQNFGMNSSQIARRQASEDARLRPAWEKAQRFVEGAGEQVAQQVNLGFQQLERDLRGFTDRYPFLQQRFDREATTYREKISMALDFTAKRLQSGAQMDLEELKQAGSIALAEKNDTIWRGQKRDFPGISGVDDNPGGL